MLTHEIWQENTDGMVLHSCLLSGPRGDASRTQLGSTATLLAKFEAGSHFEAMTIYHRYLGGEVSSTNQPWDYEPYPDDWRIEQDTKT
jgi:hypothetical protein